MKFPHPGPGMFGGMRGVAGLIVQGLFFIVMLAIVLGLIFLLVRFLLVATKAAQLYVAKNAPTPAAPAATTKPVVAPAAATSRPAPRTTKAPPPTK